MREFKVGICVRFIYNNSGIEWHHWQRPLDEWLQKQTLHCLPKSFKAEKPCFTCDDASDSEQGFAAGIFTRLSEDRVIEVIIDKYRTGQTT